MMVVTGFLLGLSVHATADQAASESPAGAPQVGQTYQGTIDRAWTKAVAGENPSSACAALKGRVIGSKDESESALRALLACNVDIPVRYFESYLDMVEAGDKTCMDYMTEMMTQLSAMTMSTDAIWRVLEKMEASGDAEAQAVATEALTEVAMDATADKGANDPKRIVKQRLADRTNETCPEIAAVVLD